MGSTLPPEGPSKKTRGKALKKFLGGLKQSKNRVFAHFFLPKYVGKKTYKKTSLSRRNALGKGESRFGGGGRPKSPLPEGGGPTSRERVLSIEKGAGWVQVSPKPNKYTSSLYSSWS